MNATQVGKGKSTGSERDVAELIRGYDWDQQIVPRAMEIHDLIKDEADHIARSFWSHFLSMPETAHIRDQMTPEMSQERATRHARYLELKYKHPLDNAWAKAARRHAAEARAVHVPLQTLLCSTAFVHSTMLGVMEQKLEGDQVRLRDLSDVLHRLALVEADIMVSYFSGTDAATERDHRRAQSEQFRQNISASIDDTAALGNRLRVQARSTSQAAWGTLGRTSQVATAAEQSAVAMREAAETAAGLIRAIEDARSEVEAAAEIATRASSQAG
ncbi:MAG: protoglobin domain-containing protein, partial [Sphingomonas sp.]